MRFCTVLLVAASLASAAATATAAGALRWKLAIEPETRLVNPCGRMEVSTKRGTQPFWYVVYTVKNTHDAPVPLQLLLTANTDSSDATFTEGFYPTALNAIRAKLKKTLGDTPVHDCLDLKGKELAPGESLTAVSVFRFLKKGGGFEEDVDDVTVKVDGFADPVKKTGLTFAPEHLQLWMRYKKGGDAVDPGKESVRYVSSEEKVVD